MFTFSHFKSSRAALGLATLLVTAPALLAFADNAPSATQNVLSNTQWSLVVPDWNLGPRARVSAPTLRFDAARLSASVGCNAMSGSYTAKGEALKVGALISTRMACGAPLDALERRYADALSSTTKWQLSRDGKTLLIQNGKEPLVFTRQASTSAKVLKR